MDWNEALRKVPRTKKIAVMTYKHQMSQLMKLREKLISAREQGSEVCEEMVG